MTVNNSIADIDRTNTVEPDDNTNPLLFVYGSLIDPIHRADILGRFIEGVPAILDDYARGRSIHWYILRLPGAQTEGVVLSGLDLRDLAKLDAYEEVPTLYTREQIEVTGMDGRLIRCWVYLPTAWAEPFLR
jgi:gamma-glutamylcyclotransferase (GGCT)/AIG2-like uncharacterized protein YtfP